MQALKDAAMLAALILLVLTVRVHLEGAPVDLDLIAPAEAATATALRPAPLRLVESAAIAPDPAVPEADCLGASPVSGALKSLHVVRRTERGAIIWEIGGRELRILLDRPEPPSPPCPLRADPQHSC